MNYFGDSFSRFNGSAVKEMIDSETNAINEILNTEIEMIENEILKNEISNPNIEIEKNLKYEKILKDYLSKNEISKNEISKDETLKIEIPKIEVLTNIIVSNTIVMLRDREPYVYIEMSPSNSRRIYTGVDIMSNIDSIWDVLTAFDKLQDVVPSLVKNEVVSLTGNGGARLSQVGGAKVLPGVTFTAKTVLDVSVYTEANPMPASMLTIRNSTVCDTWGVSAPLTRGVFPRPDSMDFLPCRDIAIQNVVGEGDFEHYQGVWRMQSLPSCAPDGNNATRLTYAVEIKPKGFLPVKLIEGRIAVDLKANLAAIRDFVEQANELKTKEILKKLNEEINNDISEINNDMSNKSSVNLEYELDNVITGNDENDILQGVILPLDILKDIIPETIDITTAVDTDTGTNTHDASDFKYENTVKSVSKASESVSRIEHVSESKINSTSENTEESVYGKTIKSVYDKFDSVVNENIHNNVDDDKLDKDSLIKKKLIIDNRKLYEDLYVLELRIDEKMKKIKKIKDLSLKRFNMKGVEG
jgi:hypothetical protein